MPNGIGERFAQAVADKDARALEALLTPDTDFRAMTPRRFWEATAAAVVHDIIFGKWFTEKGGLQRWRDFLSKFSTKGRL